MTIFKLFGYLALCLFVMTQGDAHMPQVHSESEDQLTLFILPPHHPMLKERAQEIPLEELSTEKMQNIIDEMLKIASGERTDINQRVMVGLAGPQVGVCKRLILVDVGVDAARKNLGKIEPFINPQIIWRSEEMEIGREGCFSTGKLHGIVPRAKKIRVSALDRKGNPFVMELTDFTARIFQHEIDHLDGIRFPDRLGPDSELLWVEEDEYEEYRANWQNWKRKCSFTVWLDLLEGKEPCFSS